MAKICLNMIVKNEAAIIERCLAAAAPHIDAFAICDTGSSDDTPGIIERFFASRGIPGLVARTGFRNFSQARNEALDAALTSSLDFDYLLFADADMELVVERPNFKHELTEAAYSMLIRHVSGALEYPLVRMLRRDIQARHVGLTHEYLDIGNRPRPVIPGVWFRDMATGSSRAEKYERDVRLLSEALDANPRDARSCFYLANSYYDLGKWDDAIAAYRRRIEIGGWEEELFYSNYRIGQSLLRSGREAEATRQLVNTFDKYPHRAEPLHVLALHEQRAGRHRAAHLFADAGTRVTKPDAGLFVEADVYAWRLIDIVAVSLYYMNDKPACMRLCEKILPIVPERERERIQKNIRWCLGTA